MKLIKMSLLAIMFIATTAFAAPVHYEGISSVVTSPSTVDGQEIAGESLATAATFAQAAGASCDQLTDTAYTSIGMFKMVAMADHMMVVSAANTTSADFHGTTASRCHRQKVFATTAYDDTGPVAGSSIVPGFSAGVSCGYIANT